MFKCVSFFFGVMACQICFSQTADNLIATGDSLAAQFQNEAALSFYKKAFEIDTSNCTALWKIAEAHINIGEESAEVLQRQHYYVAEKWARKTIAVCPEEANGYFFVAAASGLLALHEGGKRKIERSVDVKTYAEKTLSLDPEHHGAYHVLGRWHRELANLSWILKALAKIIYGGVPPGASNEAAVANFKKAIDINPKWVNHYKELGLTYIAIEEWQNAREVFLIALDLPEVDHQDAKHKKEIKKLLQEIKGKN